MLQTLPEAVQSWQPVPLAPHTLSAVPGWQFLLLSQQPGQLLLAQVPPQPSGAPAHLPLQLGVQLWQLPATQLLVPQAWQAAPLAPQKSTSVPGRQVVPSQQPLQVETSQALIPVQVPD